jgi:Phosphatidylinositol-4-phosphate 5-Kinase
MMLTFSIKSIIIVKKEYEPLLASIGLTNVLLAITLTASNVLTFIIDLNEFNIKPLELHIAAMIGACSGFVLSWSRIFSRSLFKKLKKVIESKDVKMSFININETDRSVEDTYNYMNSTVWNLSQFFDNLTKKVISEILITLHLRFTNNVETSTPNKLIISYPKDKYNDLQQRYSYIQKCNVYIVYDDSCTIIEYRPNLFSSIRKLIGVTDKELSDSLIFSENFHNIKPAHTNAGGKSESFFFSTLDNKYILKTIKLEEKKTFLKKLLGRYMLRISNKESKLVRVLGVFKVYSHNLIFVIMENIVPCNFNAVVYDIKGYANTNRRGKENIKKDLDFIGSFKAVDSNTKSEILTILQQDMEALMEINIMDYSVLIGEYHSDIPVNPRYIATLTPMPLVIGIIDIFQEFNFRKSAEYKILNLFSRKEFSCISPNKYYARIMSFLIKYL